MRTVTLFDICNPKQWKTISMEQLTENGYPVYGANGKIGYFHSYTHEKPTLLITCRGATCGTLNISEPFSYVNGNAMALDELSSEVDLHYLFFYLLNRNLNDVISGSAQPQITRTGLEKVRISLPPLPIQKKIAAVLEKADELRRKRDEQIKRLDELLQATFLDMFGDPVTNPKGWPLKPLNELGEVKTGNTPPSKSEGMFNGEIPFITPGDLQETWVKSARSVTKLGADKSKTVQRGATLVCCIGATIGKMGKASVFSAFNQQINAISWGEFVKADFGLEMMKFFKKQIAMAGASTTLPILKKSLFEKILVPTPPIAEQKFFANAVEKVEKEREQLFDQLNLAHTLFESLQNKAFKGELDLK